MKHRRFAALLAASAVLGVAAASAYVLQEVTALTTPAARFWAAWGERTVVVTDAEARLVHWAVPEESRVRPLFDLPAAASAIETWQDSLLIRVPGHESRLLSPALGWPDTYELVPANWHLPNVQAGGQQYRVDVDLADRLLRVQTAPGTGTLVGLLDYDLALGAVHGWAAAADRAVLTGPDLVHVVDLANPFLPAVQAVIEPPVAGWAVRAFALRDRLLFVLWGNRIEIWDLASATAPQRRAVVMTDADRLAVGERWLLEWRTMFNYPLVKVYDAADPDAVSLRGSFTAVDPLASGDVRCLGDRLLVNQRTGLHCWTVPPGTAPITADGRAWSRLRGSLLEAAGPIAYLVDERGSRFVIDLGQRRIAARQEQPATWHGFADLIVDGDWLYYNPPGYGVRVESLADPRAPQVAATISRSPQIRAISVADGLLAAAAGDELVLYDIGAPEAPVELGALILPGPLHTLVQVGTAVVVLSELYTLPAAVHVVDVADPAHPALIASIPAVDASDTAWFAAQVVVRGSAAVVLCQRQNLIYETVSSSLRIDLADPLAPVAHWAGPDDGFWCAAAGDPGRPLVAVASDRPAVLGDLHVSYRDDQIQVHRHLGAPDELELLAAWTAPGPITELWADGNRILALSDDRLDVLTLTDPAPTAVPVPLPALAVRAEPNPFNPHTRIVLATPRAGAARVEIYDGRGRHVRTLRAELPAGEAGLTWDGADAAGRDLPSGVYLLRAVLPGGTATGRCLLVR